MAKSKQSIIVGTSTDIGKTFVTCKIIEEYRNSKRALLKWKFFKLGITRFAQNYMDSIQTLLNGRGHVISKSGKELIGFVIHNTNKVQNEIRSKVNEYIMECTGNSRMFSGEN